MVYIFHCPRQLYPKEKAMQMLLPNRWRKVHVECVQGGKPGNKPLHVDIQRHPNSSLKKIHFAIFVWMPTTDSEKITARRILLWYSVFFFFLTVSIADCSYEYVRINIKNVK